MGEAAGAPQLVNNMTANTTPMNFCSDFEVFSAYSFRFCQNQTPNPHLSGSPKAYG